MKNNEEYINQANNDDDFSDLINDVYHQMENRVKFSLLENRIGNKINEIVINGTVVPSAIEQIMGEFTHLSSTPEVFITKKPILGNFFFIHFPQYYKGRNTICSISDWDSYAPPGVDAFLFYVGIRALIRDDYYYISHYDTRGCLFDFCKSKGDIQFFFSKLIDDQPFCSECSQKFYDNPEIMVFLKKLREKVIKDFNDYSEFLFGFSRMDRPSSQAQLTGIKSLQEIDLYPNNKIFIRGSQYFYSSIYESFNLEIIRDNNLFLFKEFVNRITISKRE